MGLLVFKYGIDVYKRQKDGSGDFFTVQEAVNAAVGGSKKTISILVRPGEMCIRDRCLCVRL